MALLPENVAAPDYWQDVYRQPLPFWEPALTYIAAAHNLTSGSWQRASLGRNIVFLSPTTVIKFGPPCWEGDIAREAAALQFVAARLPVATPVLIGQGSIDGWEYLIQERLPGANLWDLWRTLDSAARVDLAEQHGGLMAALHAIPGDEAPQLLHFDWARMLTEQQRTCATAMQAAGVDAGLVAQVDSYVAMTAPLLAAELPSVLLHGDLTHLNFLVAQREGRWHITGLIDWGDVKIGPRTHEFISPGVHMYRGDRETLEAWYRGYGLTADERAAELEQRIMTRTMLYYADEFTEYLQAVPGASDRQDWTSIARAFWHLQIEHAEQL